jgi:hypothetical protein
MSKKVALKPQKNSSTGFAGVYKTPNGKYRVDCQSRYIGRRDTLEEAVMLRMSHLKKLKSRQIEIS